MTLRKLEARYKARRRGSEKIVIIARDIDLSYRQKLQRRVRAPTTLLGLLVIYRNVIGSKIVFLILLLICNEEWIKQKYALATVLTLQSCLYRFTEICDAMHLSLSPKYFQCA